MNSINIFVISLEGPEWSIPKEARYTKSETIKRVDELNESLGKKENKDVTERLSTYRWHSVPLKYEGNK